MYFWLRVICIHVPNCLPAFTKFCHWSKMSTFDQLLLLILLHYIYHYYYSKKNRYYYYYILPHVWLIWQRNLENGGRLWRLFSVDFALWLERCVLFMGRHARMNLHVHLQITLPLFSQIHAEKRAGWKSLGSLKIRWSLTVEYNLDIFMMEILKMDQEWL